MIEKVILFIIALGVIFEGLFIAFAPKKARKLVLEMSKNLTKLRFFGWIEIIIGVILLIIAL